MTDNLVGMDSGYIPPPRTEYINKSLYESEKAENCSYVWENGDYQKYVGDFLQGNLHGHGKYVKLNGSKSCMYEGSFYANNFEGYSNVVYMNGDYFEGLFKCNRRFGPGVYTYADGSQNVGLWYGTQLLRLSTVVMNEWVPKLARSGSAKLKLLKYRKLVPIKQEYDDVAKSALTKLNAPPELIAMSDKLYNPMIRNPNSLFFNKTFYDMKFFGELDCTIDVADSDIDLITLSSARSLTSPTENFSKVISPKELVQDILDYLLENVSIVAEFPEPERKDFLYESILQVRKFFQLEQDTTIINSILDDFMKDLDDILSKPNDERTLILNKRIVQKLLPQDEKSKLDLNIKKIIVTDLLAWNNEEMYIEMLKHVFVHKNKENILSFSIAKLLSGDREKFNPTGELENNCMLFLYCCSVGQEKEVIKIFNENMLNPDVCDARGNTGIIFAASRDMWKTIILLCDVGANLDIVNDEGLTALSICLLRYIALLNDILDWERAFIPDAVVTYEEEQQIRQWHPHVSFTNLNALNNMANLERYTSTDEANLKGSKPHFKIGEALQAMTDEETDICHSDLYEEFREIEIDMVFKHFQKPYLETVDTRQNYVFSAKCLPSLKIAADKRKRSRSRSQSNDKSNKKRDAKKQAKIKDDDRISFAKQNKLNVVLTTIRVLLNCGSDPNLSIVPLPALLITLFCNDLELFDLVLKSGANPDITTQDEGLSALHMLCSLPFTIKNLERLKILLNIGANPNIRTNSYHWMQEKEKLLGKRELSEEDLGKTPLHIISMRYDYLRNEEIQKEMTELIINKGGNLHDTYLGHEPFSLAILRGNLELIKYYLDSGLVDPYKKLGEDMGVATTVLILKRYANALPLENCKAVYELFTEKNVNPLVEIEGNGNAIEFMETEHMTEKNIFKSQKSFASSKKQKSPKSTPRGRSKSPRSNKSSRMGKSSIEEVKKCLIECTKKMLQRHIQHQAYKYIKRFIMQDTNSENEIVTTLIRFLPTKDLMNQIQLLIHNGLIEPKPSHFYVALKMLELSKKYNKIKEKKAKFIDDVNLPSEAIIKKFDWTQKESTIYFNMIAPELDTETEKYKVCFYCLKKIGKELIVCPVCGLVYFCCQECNRLSNKESTIHKCNILFFDKQKAAYDYAQQNNLDFEISALDKEIQILNDIIKQKFGSDLEGMGISTDFDFSKLNSAVFESIYENDLDFTKAINATLEEHSLSGLDEEIKMQQQLLLEAKLKRDKGGSSTDVGSDGEQRKTGKGGKKRGEASKVSLSSGVDIRGSKRDILKKKADPRKRLPGKGAKDKTGDRRTGETSSQATKKGTRSKKGAKGSEKSFSTSESAGKRKGTKGVKDSEKSFGSGKSTRKGKGVKDVKGSEKSFGSGKSGKNAKDGKDTKSRSKSKDSHGTTKVETLYRKDRKYSKADKSSKYAVYKHDISKSDYTKSMKDKYEHEQEKMREKHPGKSEFQDWFSGGRFGYGAGFGKLTKGISGFPNEFNRLPHKCQFFIENLSALFPDIDFSLLFWPYVCYVDGQLFYRFLEERPVFLETYSNI